MADDQPFNIWTSLYKFYTQTVPKSITAPNPIIAPSTAVKTLVTAATPADVLPTQSGSGIEPPNFLDFATSLEEAFKKDPKTLGTAIRTTLGLIILAASAVSFIPGEANVGGGLAAILIHDVIEPFRRRVYEGTLDLELRPFFPTSDVPVRLLVSGVEAGVWDFSEVADELARSGIRPEASGLILKLAHFKRFERVTRDDVALLNEYRRDLQTATIQTLQDQLKGQVTDLRGQRTSLKAELKKVPEDQRADLMAELKRVDKEIANVQQLIREVPALVIGEGVDQAVARIQKAAAELAIPSEVVETRAPLLKPGTVVTDATGKRGIVLAAGMA